ncbi:hypothetical protein [Amycolatopsis sp.]|nr:hypothetical protein [Amycolatopsis sp.]
MAEVLCGAGNRSHRRPALDGAAGGQAEGIVLRSADRRTIDYDRTLRRRR